MGNSAGRIGSAITTAGISEIIRAADPGLADKIDAALPYGALENAIKSGKLSDANVLANTIKLIRDLPLGPAEHIPGLNKALDSLMNLTQLTPLEIADGFIRHEKKTPSGLAYACARASYMAYSEPNRRPKSFVTKIGNQSRTFERVDFKLPKYGVKKIHVVMYRSGGCYVLAFRGSADGNDFVTDIKAIVTSMEESDGRFQGCLKLAKELKSKFKPKEMWITGHSLGGSLAFYCCQMMHDVRGHVFNAGAGIGPLKLLKPNLRDRVTHHRVEGCPVSLNWTNEMKTIEYPNSESWAHWMTNFIKKYHQEDIYKGELKKGSKVLAKYPAFSGRADNPWFKATITDRSSTNNTYSLAFADGDTAKGVLGHEMYLAPNGAPDDVGKRKHRHNNIDKVLASYGGDVFAITEIAKINEQLPVLKSKL